MGINLGRFGRTMPEKKLNVPNIGPVLQKVGRKTMPQFRVIVPFAFLFWINRVKRVNELFHRLPPYFTGFLSQDMFSSNERRLVLNRPTRCL